MLPRFVNVYRVVSELICGVIGVSSRADKFWCKVASAFLLSSELPKGSMRGAVQVNRLNVKIIVGGTSSSPIASVHP